MAADEKGKGGTKIGVIMGCVFIVVLGMVFAIVGLLFRRKRKRDAGSSDASAQSFSRAVRD